MKTVGIGLLIASVLLVLASIMGMMAAVDSIAKSADAPRPSDLANGIASARLILIAAGPVGLLGLIWLIVGWYTSSNDSNSDATEKRRDVDGHGIRKGRLAALRPKRFTNT
jgi:hypothetical protein